MIVYVGNFITERVKRTRGLPAWNPAGVNRMRRISEALRSCGHGVLVLSPSGSLRMRPNGRWYCPSEIEYSEGLSVVHAPALAVPGLNVLIEPFLLLWQMIGICRRQHVSGVLLYCYYPSHALAALVARFCFHLPIVLDMEDVSRPRLRDWRRGSETAPIHQIVGWLCLQATLAVVRGVFVPTERFLPYAGQGRREVITGCMPIPTARHSAMTPTVELRVLFAGKIEFEHGIDILLDAMRDIEREPRVDGMRIHCDVCGQGTKLEWARAAAAELRGVEMVIHGFVHDADYARLLDAAHICCVLQKPDGRHALFKTPSKGYEFMGHGKATVVTSVGDFPGLPEDTRLMLNNCTGEALADILRNIQPDSIRAYGAAALDYARRNWTMESNGRVILELFGWAATTSLFSTTPAEVPTKTGSDTPRSSA